MPFCENCEKEHGVANYDEEEDGKSCIHVLSRERNKFERENGELRGVIWDLKQFIGDTFYANVRSDEKPLPNSWYKGTSKTYGAVLQGILDRVPGALKPECGVPVGRCYCGGCVM